jgi:zinc transport system substrate-binding protein
MRAPLLVAALLLAGCAQPSDEPPADVLASFYPLAYLASEVAGPDLRVGTLVPAGVEPHDYEPTPNDVKRARQARVLLVQGASFESWIRTVTDAAPDTRVVTATAGLALRGEGNAPPDPHTWLDPALYANASRTVEAALAEAFPAHAEGFHARGEALRANLTALDADFAAGLASCETRVLVTAHAAFGYLSARYDLTMVALSGLDPDAEPSAEAIRAAVDAARAHNVTTIFFEELVSPRVAEAVAREVGAATRVLSPVEGIPPDEAAQGASYETKMRENLASLREGLRCR